MTWRRRLREAKASGAAYDLAITILAELHKLDHNAVKEIILSGEVTGLPEQTRRRAIKDLVQINLIKVERKEGQAYRATQLHYIKRTSRE
jgi:predicted transcriptional regulator